MKLNRILSMWLICALLFGCADDQRSSSPSESDYFKDYEADEMKWGLVNIEGDVMVPNIYDDLLDPINKDLIAANFKGKWGFIDAEGTSVIPFQYKTVKNFSDDYAFVQLFDNHWQLIDTVGQVVQIIRGQKFSNVKEGMFAVKKPRGWQYKSVKKQDSLEMYFHKISDFINGTAIVKNFEKYGVINKEGKVIVDYIYSGIKYDRDLNRFIVKDNGSYHLLDIKGKRISDIKYENVSLSQNKTFAYQSNGAWFLSNELGQIVDLEAEKIIPGGDGIWLFRQEGMYGLIDQFGKIIMEAKYPLIQQFQDSMAVVMKTKSSWNYINTNGQEVLSFDLPIAFDFKNGYARIATPEGIVFLEKSGKLVRDLVYPEMKDFHNGLARFQHFPSK